MSETPPLSLHCSAFGINPVVDEVRVEGQVIPTLTLKRDKLDPQNNVETEDDIAHTGQDTNKRGKDKVMADSKPSIEDRLRFDEGLEDWCFMWAGTHDEVVAAISGATTAKKWVIYRDVSTPVSLPWGSFYDFFNWESEDATVWIDAYVNTLNFNFNVNNAPKIGVDFISNYNKPNQTAPTRVFPDTEYKLKAMQGTIYMGPVGTTEAALEADEYKFDCYTEAELNLSNNMESRACGGMNYGETKKDRKPMTGTGSIKMDYNTSNRDLIPEFITGTAEGTEPTPESMYKAILIKYTGKLIETVDVSGVATPVYCSFAVFLPKVEVTNVDSPRYGDATKDLTVEYEVVSDSTITTNPVQFTIISPCDALHYGTTS
jgi:hypothetical protein